MQMPAALRAALERAVSGFPLAELERAAAALSDAYRSGRPPKLDTEAARAAYAITRLPATFAAVRLALRELPEGCASAADLGSGFGASAWAIREALGVEAITRVERNAALLAWAREKLETPGEGLCQDLGAASPKADLQLFSYSLGELSATAQEAAVDRAWANAGRALVIVEPGTMAGFGVVRRARARLLAAGAQLAAPCPHPLECPIRAGDWCHFAARVERTALHRRLKGGSLGHEDEKFSYAMFTREPGGARPAARVIRHPQVRPGLIELTLCRADGTAGTTKVTQRDKEAWRAARKAEWGAAWASIR